MKCRHCNSELSLPMIDLGSAPPSNAYLTEVTLRAPEKWFPLRVLVCTECWLVQTEDYVGAEELFSRDYAYFSSYSTTWLKHAEAYVSNMVDRFSLDDTSMVVEIAANDGYLLQYVKERGIPCLGVEPTSSTASAARRRGIVVEEEFFGVPLAERLAATGWQADLMVANNVLAHVPDINDFVSGFSRLLKQNGVATFEFPHLLNLVQQAQFDTIYHEHYSYLSLIAVDRIFREAGLQVFEVEELETHGGSLRVYAQRRDTGTRKVEARVAEILENELESGICSKDFYTVLQQRADQIKLDLLLFLANAKKSGMKVCAYGAAAKGNTLLNFAGVRSDLLSYVVDRNTAKQGCYLPGSRIPVVSEGHLRKDRPDRVLILPWNLTQEVTNQMSYIREWGGRFVTAVPSIQEA